MNAKIFGRREHERQSERASKSKRDRKRQKEKERVTVVMNWKLLPWMRRYSRALLQKRPSRNELETSDLDAKIL